MLNSLRLAGGGGPTGLEDRSSAFQKLWLVALDVALPRDWVSSTAWALDLALSRCLVKASCVFPTLRPGVGSGEDVCWGLHSSYC